MATDELVKTTTGIAHHGAERLPSVDVDSFNIEIKDDDGFLGDRASKGAFREILDRWRKPLRKSGEDPFGDEPSDQISKNIEQAMQRHAEREVKHIGVDVKDGTVTLTGKVGSYAERKLARGVAWSAPGVCAVVDDLVVE